MQFLKYYRMKQLATIIILVFFTSCASVKFSKFKRGKYNYNENQYLNNVLDVNVTLLPLPKQKKVLEKPKTFFDLRDSIPNTLLRVLGENTNSADSIIKLIREPLSIVPKPKPTTITTQDFTTYTTRILFSNIKKYFVRNDLMHDNTRLEYLNTTVKLDSKNFEFYTIDKLENELETIDLGNLERTNNVSFGIKGTVQNGIDNTFNRGNTNESKRDGSSNFNNTDGIYDANGSFIGTQQGNTGAASIKKSNENTRETKISASQSLEASYQNSENIKENILLSRSTLKTGFSFSPKHITITQRGRPLQGIFDNELVTVTLKATKSETKDYFKFSSLFKDYQPKGVNNIDFQQIKAAYIPCNSKGELDIDFEVSYDGVLRAVRNLQRGNIIGEFDDKVTYYRVKKNYGKNKKPSNSISIDKFDYCKKFYEVRAKVKGEEYALHIEVLGNSTPVILSDEDASRNFKGWLNLIKIETNKSKFQTKKMRLYFQKIKMESDGTHKKLFVGKKKMTKNDINKLKTIKEIELIEL